VTVAEGASLAGTGSLGANTIVTGISKSVQLRAIPGVNTATSTAAKTLHVNGEAGFPSTVANHGFLAVSRNDPCHGSLMESSTSAS
jgi:hypothetical protein